MEILRKYSAIIGIVAVALILVVIRTTGNRFKPDAEKWAAASFDRSNIVTFEEVSGMEGEKYIINLDPQQRFHSMPNAVNIEPQSLLEKKNIKRIRKNKGPVILYSEDPSVSAGTWMIMSQIGIKNIYILSETDDEVNKNEFHPKEDERR